MYQTILHATDLSEDHFEMCQHAADIANAFNAKLYLLHVIEPPASLQIAQGLGFAEFDKPVTGDAEIVLRTVGEALNIPIEQQFVAVGSIKQHVLDKINEWHCDLLIIGSHTPSQLPGFLESTAHTIIGHATCDVLTLR